MSTIKTETPDPHKAPSKYYIGGIHFTVSSPQFKDKEALEMFLKEVLESFNGTQFKIHAIPSVEREQPYD
jgi:hypothetical protein